MPSLPPILNSQTKILILGSYPSNISLQRRQYFANPGNDFWKVMSIVINKDLTKKTYDDKINTLLRYNIGLWDVLESCDRAGSMDNKILNGRPNNFVSLLKRFPNIKVILILGTQGYDIFRKLKISISQYYIPSTSGANRAKYDVNQKAKIIRNYIRH